MRPRPGDDETEEEFDMRVNASLVIGAALVLAALGLAAPAQGAAAEPADAVVLVEPGGRWHVAQESGGDYTFFYGAPGDVPLLGDWDGDGFDTPGVFRPTDGSVHLTNRLPDHGTVGRADEGLSFYFGMAGDQPLVGDWDGDGIDTLGIRRGGTVHLTNTNATGVAAQSFFFGVAGDRAAGGDPAGGGPDRVFLHRASAGTVYYSEALPIGGAAATAGAFAYGIPTDRLVVGDWDGDGVDTAGVFRPSEGRIYLRNSNSEGPADVAYAFGEPTWTAVAGRVAATRPGLPIRINAGGPALAALDGGPDWEEDSAARPSRYVNFTASDPGNHTAAWPVPDRHESVPVGTPPWVFATERYDEPGGAAMHWHFPLAAGETVEVRLLFASGFDGADGIAERLFDVTIDGWEVMDDYDVVADVGHGMGVMKRFIVTTDTNGLDIVFTHHDPAVQNPLLNAIEIRQPDRLRIVEPTGFPVENGTALRDAMAAVAAENPGPDDRWIVKLLPGAYDMGDAPLSLVPYVEVEGSGEAGTHLTRTGYTPDQTVRDDGVIQGTDHSTLRHLSVGRPTGGADRLSSRGIVNTTGAPRVESVTVSVYGHHVAAIYTDAYSDTHLFDVTVRCDGGPSWSSCLEQRDGGHLYASNLTMTGSVGNPGALTGISFVYSSAVVSNASMELSGPGVTAAGGGKGVLRLHRATVSLDGRFRGTTGFSGMFVSMDLADVTIDLAGSGAATTGLDIDIGSAVLERVTLTVSSGDAPTGILAANADVTITDSAIAAREDVYNTGWGIDLGEGSYDLVTVTGSSITAPSATVRSTGTPVEVRDSTLAGGPVIGNGLITCTNVWDEHGTYYPGTCPG